MKELTKDEAIKMFDSKEYNGWDSQKIVEFQLFQPRLCMPFPVFSKAMSDVLGRPVYTHEFGNKEALIQEYFGCKKAPTEKEIINMIQVEKRIIIKK